MQYYKCMYKNRTEARIYLSNFEHNIQEIKKITNNKKICIAVKANAYGHGSIEIAKKASQLQADFISIATVPEGSEIRNAGINLPMLLLGVCNKEEIDSLVKNNITPLVADIEFVQLLENAIKNQHKKDYNVHIKLDTGMSRHGCNEFKAFELAQYIKNSEYVQIEGICTHFAVSDSEHDDDIKFTKQQIAVFSKIIENLTRNGIDVGIKHCSASGGILLYPESHFDMVRPGILCYGYLPDPSLTNFVRKNNYNFKPVMELVTHVTAIKKIKAGDAVSYGRTWIAPSDTTIASLCIGYADGFNRLLSNNFEVTIGLKRYPIIGRICMDQCLVDIGTDCIERWSEAIIFGPHENTYTAMDVAKKLDTISYEVLCLITQRVVRKYV